MKSLLNRALNFSILPLKLDITQVLVDFNRFSRAVIWHEYWYGKDTDEAYKKQIFKSKKSNLPKNYSSPAGLKTFLGAIRSEIMDPKNRNSKECNIPPDEIVALQELIKLQKERVIIIKAANKGAGIVILNFQDYMKACYEHLLSSAPTQNTQNDPHMYYTAVNEFALEEAKSKIIETLELALNKEIITKEEFGHMKQGSS